MSNSRWNPQKFEMFSEARIAILKKIREHPPLLQLLLQYDPVNQWPEMLGEIAAYCNIVVDGVYTKEELDRLEDILYQKLSEASIVLYKTPVISAEVN